MRSQYGNDIRFINHKKPADKSVDMVIRQMLDDVNLKSDAIVTFNPDVFAMCVGKEGGFW